MQESTVLPYAEAHGQAIVAGDLDHAMADLTEEVRNNLGPVAAAFPQPTTGSEVVSISSADDGSVVAHIRYSGGDGSESVTVRSVWRQIGDRPIVVEAALA